MASETKTSSSRRKSSSDTKTSTAKPTKKTVAPAKTASKISAPKAKPAKAKDEKPVKKTAARKPKSTGQPITVEARLRHIEVAAYYIAEKSGFSRTPADCWSAAECEVDGLLLAGKL